MVDFLKLLDRTPEERAADLERASAEFRVRNQQVIEGCKEIIQQLMRGLESLDPDGRRFVASLAHMAVRHDPISGLEGGRLLDLSQKQKSYIQSLHERVLRDAIEPAPGSRAERFRS